MKEFLNKIIEGDTLKILKTIPDNYVDLGIRQVIFKLF